MCGRFRRDDAVKSNCGAKVTAGFVEALEARLAKLEAQQMSKGPLDGKVALVTGGSRGLGLGMALGMAEAGAHVVLNGRGEEALVTAQATIAAHGGSASIAVFDVTDETAIRDLLGQRAPKVLRGGDGARPPKASKPPKGFGNLETEA